MNKSRINRALDNIDELIILCEREFEYNTCVQTARESLSYIRFILEQLMNSRNSIDEAIERIDSVTGSLDRIGRHIDDEPQHIPLSLK